ncbi:acetylxylan esterase [Rhizosphaericola mali]|uniref:Acetylxylan esterase n=1 Tax=Rhizosphaericola mali TaxID=2545455 RepID=A0A5P2G454_9BACT|nr:acetylxylan esterase [Rhizosphaericola mali]QES88602.1 acetylxylan esterase [Rhizosphaericola mali]
MIGKYIYKIFIVGLFCICLQTVTYAQQDSDHNYAKPLKSVLVEIQNRYGVTIQYKDKMVEGKVVPYADWRLRPDVETSLSNVLSLFDMKVEKVKDKTYKLKDYEYYRWALKDGWAELDRIASQYHNQQQWELRKDSLKKEMLHALQLDKIPKSNNVSVIKTKERKYDGYSVSNIAVEILPGVYFCGSLYKPNTIKGKIPIILNPDGHWPQQRYRADCQYRCAALAKMGAMAFSYDLFAWGESMLQFPYEDHRKSIAMPLQILASFRILDYLLTLPEADNNRVGITGGSGGGTLTIMTTALDDRIKVSSPVVSVSSYFYGGCPCESGMPVHFCAGGTDNVEIAAMAAPRPQLLISDGSDWTANMPEHDFPYLQKIYGYFGKTNAVQNVHLPDEKHDFGINKRTPVYNFMAKYLGLNINSILKNSVVDESFVTVEKENMMYVFGDKGQNIPINAIKGCDNLMKLMLNYK